MTEEEKSKDIIKKLYTKEGIPGNIIEHIELSINIGSLDRFQQCSIKIKGIKKIMEVPGINDGLKIVSKNMNAIMRMQVGYIYFGKDKLNIDIARVTVTEEVGLQSVQIVME